MQKKIYVTGMDDDAAAGKVDEAVKAIAGVTSVVSTAAKCQVCVDYDEGTAGIEDAINAAISSAGVTVLG
ncbi:MAG: cation transporter [Treponema sp.]|nr:cation transporter [Treponema sp.]MBQ5399885.1 cation transporter [Treponema sp.]